MTFTDPFRQDTQRYRDLINKDAGYTDFEEVQEVKDDPAAVLDNGTVKGLPPSIFKEVTAKAKKLEADKEKKGQVAKVFNDLFTDLNNKYGLNVKFDFDSFTGSLSYMIQPTSKRAMELYLSDAYGIFRVTLYQQYLVAIAMLASQILDPAYLLSESMTYSDKLETMSKLYEFMKTMEEIYKEVNIPDSGVKLEKLSEGTKETYSLNDPNVRAYMEQLFNKVKK